MAYIHEKPILISEAHLDSFGHLNHARYFELLEQARWDLITERNFGIDVIRRTKTGPVILEVTMKYMRELGPREPVVIRSELLSYEGKVGSFRQQIVKQDGAIACDATFSFGLFDLERRRLIEPTPAWRYAIGVDTTPPG
ncbi:MAG TPA: acyl-CoA thioesterase [Polyangia bacterium]|nr:acyl-CoA thioesterase [Polyangia bacterium]